MRFLFLLLSTLFAAGLAAQSLQIGDETPPLSFTVLGDKVEGFTPEATAGKAILLDFWATWCSPCIGGMPHLDELQNAFPDKLQVIAVSEEKEARLQRFINNTNHRFLFAQDTGALKKLFPYQTIPHSVLIAPNGVVVAITSPENISKEVIKSVIDGEVIDLPFKQDRQGFDPGYDYFQADTLTRQSFQLQPHNPNVPTFTKSYWEGPFSGRRYTAYNMTIDGLYRHAYQTTSLRLELEFDEALVDWENEKNRYCMDIIVDDPAELLTLLRQKLAETVQIQARVEKRTKDVVVISTLEGEVVANQGEQTNKYSGRGDGFNSTGATMEDFCSYLERFGIFNYPVLDETGTSAAYEIDFSFDPENSDSFREAMNKYGLDYTKASREIEVLVLYLRD